MSTKKISIGFILGSLNIFIDGLIGIAILPILLNYLGKEKAGLWILYTSFWSFISLAQAGLGPIIVRMASGLKDVERADANAHFIKLVKYSYCIVIVIVAIITVLIYFIYLNDVLLKEGNLNKGVLVWCLYSIGCAIRIYSAKNINIINGLGELGWDKILNICTSIVTFAGYYVSLRLYSDMLGLGLVFAVSSLILLIGSSLILNRFIGSYNALTHIQIKPQQLIDLFKQSGKMLILNLSGFFIMNLDIFIVERYFGLSVLPMYSALVKIVAIMITIALLIQQMTYPYVAINWSNKKYDKCKKLYKQGIIYSVGIGILMSSVLLVLAPYIIPIWLGKGFYLGSMIFGLKLLSALIYIHHCAHASPVIATGGKTFISTAVANAALAVPLCIIGASTFGIKGMILGNIFATIIPSIYVVLWSYRFFNSLPSER